ncbi:MAG: DUF4242 domain-containing protein [Dehalococcoidia bacterium]|nr:DUF4242 domain-containing protein [Dehalococcoidia bacterium]
MPKFMDYHPMPNLPPEAMQQEKAAIEAGKADANGVTPLNLFAGTDGSAFCYTEAANADAVIKMHAAMGLTLERHQITEVNSLV